MTIRKLALKNFRNFENLELEFSGRQTLLVGANGSGKSAILEAIYLLASGLSRRAEREEEIISWGSSFAKIRGFLDDSTDLDLTLSVGANGRLAKTAQINGVKKPLAQFLQNFFAVQFSPQDLELVSGPPEGRRRYLNGVLTQVSGEYHQSLSLYEKARHEKNALLLKIQEGTAHEKELDIWNEQLLIFGKKIQQKREAGLNFLSNNDRDLVFEYHPSLLSSERLAQFVPREVAAGVSLIGPHRDDFSFTTHPSTPLRTGNSPLTTRNLAHFGSRGEQRMAVFTLKNRELDYFQQGLKVEPILLLDDIFSELDDAHRREVLARFGSDRGGQVVFTATDVDLLEREFAAQMKVLTLSK